MPQFILDFIRKKANSTYLSRGKAIYNRGSFNVGKLDTANGESEFKVRSESYSGTYKVQVTGFQFGNQEYINAICECPIGHDFCKHAIAATYALNEELEKLNFVPEIVAASKEAAKEKTVAKVEKTVVTKPVVEKPKKEKTIPIDHTKIIVKWDFGYDELNEWQIKKPLSPEDNTRIGPLARGNRATITESQTQSIQSEMVFKNEKFYTFIQKTGKGKFEGTCTCDSPKKKLCLHQATALLQLLYTKGAYAFELMRNWDSEKNKFLADYGFSVDDKIDGKFSFSIDAYGRLAMQVLDKTLMSFTSLNAIKPQVKEQTQGVAVSDRAVMPSDLERKKTTKKDASDPDRRLLSYAFNVSTKFPFFTVAPIIGRHDTETMHLLSHVDTFLDFSGNVVFDRIHVLASGDFEVLQNVRSLNEVSFSKYFDSIRVRREYNYATGHSVDLKSASAEQKQLIHSHISKHLNIFLQDVKEKVIYLSNDSNRVSINTIKPLRVAEQSLGLHFETKEENGFITLRGILSNDAVSLALENMELVNPFFTIHQNTLYSVRVPAEGLDAFQTILDRKKIVVPSKVRDLFIKNILHPLQQHFRIIGDLKVETKTQTIDNQTPIRKIYLKEAADALIIHPVLEYNNIEVELDGQEVHTHFDGEQIIEIERNLELEEAFKNFLLELHPSFESQFFDYEDGHYFWLEYHNVSADAWFLNFFEKVEAENIEIFGFSKLKKFKFNKNRAAFKMNASSGLDWFDIQAEVQFGDQIVGIKELRKAIVKKQNYIQLADGTLGILPDEWLEKYGAVFRVGQIHGDSLEVSKLHFSLVDQLYDEIDDEAVLKELNEKRLKLRNFTNISEIKIPASINATLRPYQKEGFNWLNFLDEFNWGGCLADDMGLGKTLQVITFFRHIKENTPNKTNLVVAPTSLVYNWESEVQKFAPDLRVLIYHGAGVRKSVTEKDFEKADIVITTYGTATSDIEKLQAFKFHYIVLDESQAIKNVDTKRYKAMRLLQGQNRLCMSGTPVENNTFDLYAQFNFINPGFLGSMEFFREEYASPIDKNRDADKTAELRRIVQPFMLRRTKELVADDLPEKTEIVLYCEMDKKQRAIYDSTKKKFKEKILGMISERGGVKNAAMYVLEGLLRLRQICDSPALIGEDELGDVAAESTKLVELMEHVTERTGNHKMLVFSQFKGMLSLIRRELEDKGIPFCYLDGSTSLNDRRKAVNNFQDDPKYRVFLISLKAGGTGLNLTAADYVYLMDPWWNPAVEQQAIDRAHRIGQKNHIFAYKMICKDSVEEKIIQLQDKKKAIAADLVTSDTGFMSSLSKSDIEFLFS